MYFIIQSSNIQGTDGVPGINGTPGSDGAAGRTGLSGPRVRNLATYVEDHELYPAMGSDVFCHYNFALTFKGPPGLPGEIGDLGPIGTTGRMVSVL